MYYPNEFVYELLSQIRLSSHILSFLCTIYTFMNIFTPVTLVYEIFFTFVVFKWCALIFQREWHHNFLYLTKFYEICYRQ